MTKEIKTLISKADTLLEALPYIRKFYNKTVVIKFGGSAMSSIDLKEEFALDIILMKYIGISPIIVHGGGPQIGKTLEKMGKKTEFVDGLRITDDETLDIVEMVLVGKVNKEIVSLINMEGGQAVGLSGKDGELIKARKYNVQPSSPETDRPEIIDLGRVGEVVKINCEVINTLIEKDFIPVIAPLGVGKDGIAYNINADFVASEISKELKAEKLILLTDTEGVLSEDGTLINTLNKKELDTLIERKIISDGMIPKVKCCVNALEAGVKKAHIVDGRLKHSVILEIFTKEGVGTEIIE